MARPWAEIDEDWKRKEERALAQRAANAAAREDRPLPYPSPFSALGPTKLCQVVGDPLYGSEITGRRLGDGLRPQCAPLAGSRRRHIALGSRPPAGGTSGPQ